jgi:hypothetical protein
VPAVALSRVGARVAGSGPGGTDLAAGAWQWLEMLPDPRSPQGRIYPLACLIAIAVTRWRKDTATGKISRETAHAVTSLTSADASAQDLARLLREHWSIEAHHPAPRPRLGQMRTFRERAGALYALPPQAWRAHAPGMEAEVARY